MPVRLALLLLLAACDPAPAYVEAGRARATVAGGFPAPSRPVSSIVTDRWSNEDERERTGEADTVIRLAGVRPGMGVADIGAGEGFYTLKLARAVGPTGIVYGNDVVPRYARALEARLKRARVANARVVLGGEDDPKLPPASIDRAFLIHMYHEIAQPYALMWRLHASMRPGGVVAIVDADRPTDRHGTPPALLRCELAAVGFRPAGFHDLGDAGGYLALFLRLPTRPEPSAIRACAAPDA